MKEFYLPQLVKTRIDKYPLFKCPLEIEFGKPINIIFGTNGIGKSTLLQLLIYSIIGPYRGGIKTKTYKEDRKDNRPIYVDDFFRSRGEFECLGDSTIFSEFYINKDFYRVRHSLFDNKLLEVDLNGTPLSGRVITYTTYESKYSKSRNKNELISDNLQEYLIYNYQTAIEKSSSLPGGMNTLINMILDVMLFDENREFTFWKPSLQETVIGKYIVDAEFFENYLEQQLTSKALESAYKKKSETANFLKKFLEKEKKSTGKEPTDREKIQMELSDIDDSIEAMESLLTNLKKEISRTNQEYLKLIKTKEKLEENLKELHRIWYSVIFPPPYKKYLEKFESKMLQSECPICGNTHEFRIESEKCILCDELIYIQSDDVNLTTIDTQRKAVNDSLSENVILLEQNSITQKRLEEQLSVNSNKYRKLINRKNVLLIQVIPRDADGFHPDDLSRIERANEERSDSLERLNKSREIEERMRDKIEQALVKNFSIFADSFKIYSHLFYGDTHETMISLPNRMVNIEEVNLSSMDDLMIQFSLDNKTRDESYMLSESQRIFTDLAFRFAVLTTYHTNSFFICETPDSTLDKYHEDKAAKTFGAYVRNRNTLIMSANVRQSKLISNLIKLFGQNMCNIINLTQLSNLATSIDRVPEFLDEV